jgi:membrane protein DedA with SNARE-associated domain
MMSDVIILVGVWASGYVLGAWTWYLFGRRQKVFGVNDDAIREALED